MMKKDLEEGMKYLELKSINSFSLEFKEQFFPPRIF